MRNVVTTDTEFSVFKVYLVDAHTAQIVQPLI